MEFDSLANLSRYLGSLVDRVKALEDAKPAWGKPTTPACSHAMQEVKMGKLTVFATRKANVKNDTPLPDIGLYLDVSWLDILTTNSTFLSFGVKPFKTKTPYPFVVVRWPDMQAISLDIYRSVVEWARETAGTKRLEISCVGGHGRTGTVLAGIAALELSLKADDAIKYIRENYCKEAIEGIPQENLVRSLLGEEVKKTYTPPTYTPMPYAQAIQQSKFGHGMNCFCADCKEAMTHEPDCICEKCEAAFPSSVQYEKERRKIE